MTCTCGVLWGVFLSLLAVPPPLAAQDAGANSGPRNCTPSSMGSVFWFSRNGPERLTACIAAGADINARGDNGWTPLHWATINASNDDDDDVLAVVEALIAAGADVNARDDDGEPPLHEASSPSPAVVEALIAAGADVNARDDGGETPLHEATKFDRYPAVIEVLLAAGADMNARDQYGRTPLHLAVNDIRAGATTRALLAAGANTEARDEDGNRPLHTAAKYVHWAFPDNLERIGDDDPHAGDAIEALLAAGADPTARNAAGQTPWDLAQENGALQGSDAYWRLNDARFNAPGPGARRAPAAVPGGGTVGDPAGNTGAVASGGQCLVPDYPSPPGGVASLGFSWCPASVDIQRRSFALQAAGAQCAIATDSSSTPEQITARRQEIKAACDRLDALQSPDIPTCQCPAGLRP